MAAVDPGGAKPSFLGWHVVVIEALRRVQEALLGDAPLRDPRQQVFEIAQVRLVGADVLGRKDSVELDAELFVAPRERRLVNVGKDEQLVVTFEVVERVGRIGKGRPIADRGAEGLGLGVRGLHPPGVRHALERVGDELRIDFEESIRRLATLANLRGFNGMFVLQPIIGIDGKPYAPGERRWIDMDLAEGKIFRRSKFYELVRPFYVSLSETHRDDKTLCYADLSGVFKNIEDRVYVDEGHLNSDGNRIVARAVVDQLAACGFLQSSAAAANAPADQISAVPAVR